MVLLKAYIIRQAINNVIEKDFYCELLVHCTELLKQRTIIIGFAVFQKDHISRNKKKIKLEKTF